MSDHIAARTKEISTVLRRIAKEVRVTAQGSSRIVMYDALANEIEGQAHEVELLGGGRTRKGLVNT